MSIRGNLLCNDGSATQYLSVIPIAPLVPYYSQSIVDVKSTQHTLVVVSTGTPASRASHTPCSDPTAAS